MSFQLANGRTAVHMIVTGLVFLLSILVLISILLTYTTRIRSPETFKTSSKSSGKSLSKSSGESSVRKMFQNADNPSSSTPSTRSTPSNPDDTDPLSKATTKAQQFQKSIEKHKPDLKSLQDDHRNQLKQLRSGMNMYRSASQVFGTSKNSNDPHSQHKQDLKRIKDENDQYLMTELRKDPMPSDKAHVVSLLWSGGLWSTFRLCELLLVQRRTVRPIFLSCDRLDTRQSFQQEQATIKALVDYLKQTYPQVVDKQLLQVQTIRCDQDKVGGMNIFRNHTTNQNTVRMWMTALELPLTPTSSIPPFYIALARLTERQDVYDTFLRKGTIELVLSDHTPHKMLLAAVKKWGTRVSSSSSASSASKIPFNCLYTVSPDARLPEDSPRNTFARAVAHLRFVRPCSTTTTKATPKATPTKTRRTTSTSSPSMLSPPLLRYAEQHGFSSVLTRTWSCRHPQHTQAQLAQMKQDTKTLTLPRYYSPPPPGPITSKAHREWEAETARIASSAPETMRTKSIFPKPVKWQPCYRCSSCVGRSRERVGEMHQAQQPSLMHKLIHSHL